MGADAFSHLQSSRAITDAQAACALLAKAWDNSWVGVWQKLGATRLVFLEYLLIGVASMVSPQLLNREGLGRLIGK